MIQSWSFQKKVGAGFVVMLALTSITTGVAAYALRSVVSAKDHVIEINGQNLIEGAELDTAVNRQAAGFRGYLATRDDRFLAEREAARSQTQKLRASLAQRVYTKEGADSLIEIEQTQAKLAAAQDRAVSLLRGGGTTVSAVRILDGEILPLRDQLDLKVRNFLELEKRLLKQGKSAAGDEASTAMMTVFSLAVAAALFAGLTFFFLARLLSRQVGGIVQHVQSSSTELQTAANQQATGAREAATAVAEVLTTMTELLASSRQITESAQRVTHIAQETAKASVTGDQNVSVTQEAIHGIRRQVDVIVSHMLELGKKSQQIGDILEIINELSEQSNILAINASIEAAGAGEAGKRFAVVGDETRKLADRVSASTKQVRSLVEEIRAAVNTTVMATESGSKATDAGLHHFEEVARRFKHIADMVATTTEAAREIELSTKQQATAVEQVNSAIDAAAQVSRETEVSSTQMLQTATELAHLSHELSRLVQSNGKVESK